MRRLSSLVAGTLFLAGSSVPAHGQSNPATGETYHVEVTGILWKPDPKATVRGEQFGISGTDISLADDLGVAKKRFKEIRLVLRPARKHKFRIDYIPISYSSTTRLTRTLVFNGQRYDTGRTVTTDFQWKAARLGYEYDFIYRDRGFLGFLAEAKYTSVKTTLDAGTGGPSEFSRVRAPIPAIGLIARVYPASNVALTGEISGFRLPKSINKDYQGRYADVDVNVMLNFTDQAGFTIGYRSLNVFYQLKRDNAHFDLRGLYFGGTLRY